MPSTSKRGHPIEHRAYELTVETALTLAKRLRKGVKTLHRAITEQIKTSQEPYCELSQTSDGMRILLKLPEVRERDITIRVAPSRINIVGKNSSMLFLKTVELSPQADVERIKVSFRQPTLKIKIPFSAQVAE